MLTTGQRLGRVQFNAHGAIDAAYAPLVAETQTIIMRYAVRDERGIVRIPPFAQAAILAEIARRLTAIQPQLLTVVVTAVRAAMVEAQRDAVRSIRANGSVRLSDVYTAVRWPERIATWLGRPG